MSENTIRKFDDQHTPVVVSAARTATGKFGGSLSGINCPDEVPAWTVNKNCGTGLKAINITA